EKIIKEIEAQTELNQNLSALKNADENILSDVKEVLEKEQEINHKKRA
ncbi:TPA: hypothetical protein R7188_001789, partial [Campylobacter coli]|nr:hypothetical protein [Campylobacter coli]